MGYSTIEKMIDLEDVSKNLEQIDESGKNKELSPAQTEYIDELNVSPQEWEAMSESDRKSLVGTIQERVEEFSPDLEDKFIDYIRDCFEPQLAEQCFESHGLNDTTTRSTVVNDWSSEKYWFVEQTVDNVEFERSRPLYQDDLKLGYPHDSNVLRSNLELATGNNPENASAHHVVGNETPIAAAKLEEYGIDRNDPTNGIFLPNNMESDCEGTLHTGRHSKDYYNQVECRFQFVESKADAIDVLQSIKEDLYSDVLKLQNA